MNGNLRSGLLAGLIAAFIWMMISTAVDLGKTAVMVGGLACLLGTWLITAAIAAAKSRAHQRA